LMTWTGGLPVELLELLRLREACFASGHHARRPLPIFLRDGT
jgi:hypothetical protein